MTYRLGKCYPDGMLILPEGVLEHITEAGEHELRILLRLASILKNEALTEEEILEALNGEEEADEVRLALAFWRGCGVIGSDSRKKGGRSAKKPMPKPVTPSEPEVDEKEPKPKKTIDADEAPFYSAKDLADAADREPAFKSLVSFTEGRLEKVLNASELARLWSFLDYLKMPADVVMLVIEDCVAREKRSLRYVTKMLTSFADDGITDYAKAESYFAARQEKNQYDAHVRRLFGLGERKLSAAEDEILNTWRNKFGYGTEILDAAYEKTVASAKNPSIRYMHKILESWYKDGVRVKDDIGKKASPEKAEKSYDLDDFFEKAVSRGRKEG